MKEDTQYYNRETGKLEKESILGDRWLRLAYLSPIRGALQWPLFSHALFSRLMGWYLDRPSSVKRIAPTVRQLGINMDEVIIPEGGFTSFNDFFARELKPSARPLPQDPNLLISPADCRLTVYPLLTAGLVVPVKGPPYSMADLLGLQGSRYARAFDGGSLMVCRLCPADYHRYHFPDDGLVEDYWVTHGKYHSVHPIALQRGHRVFAENFRTARIMALRHGGLAAMFSVGAFGVASIHDFATDPQTEFYRGGQAGFFTFGGSTVILAFQANRCRFDEDLVAQSAQGVETLVKVNSPIGAFLAP